jgi:AmmeMemoRadiSam system protein B
MAGQSMRRPAVAGSWYPGTPGALAREVDGYLAAAGAALDREPLALIAPHAGIMFSGPVAAHAYASLRGSAVPVAVLVGPSHFVGFDGVAVYPEGAFDTPLGPAPVDAEVAAELMRAWNGIQPLAGPHGREHSLEMQLPFLRRVAPETAIVPLLMGYQDPETIRELAGALERTLAGRRALLVASTDLSHYFDDERARQLDAGVLDCVERLDPEALLAEFLRHPEGERGRCVGCGAGPAIAVLMAARALGARRGHVLRYATSGEVSGDYTSVVGYMAAAITF